MDALTSDIVWMVNQTVTLPDGSTQTVLAPVVYLAHAHANDLQPTGALIAADDVEIHATGNATNSGVIKGGTQTVIGATNIVNRGGSIGSSTDNGTTVLSASNDLVNASGRITGNRVAVLAGHDIVNTTLVDPVDVSSVAGNSKVTQTLVGAQGVIASTGDMVMVAGNDLTLHGANLIAGGNAQIAAGHDINVDTVQSHTTQSVTTDANNFTHAESTLNQTSSIGAGGSLAMQSGNDMTFRGADVSAGTDLAVVAGGNLTATTVTNSASNVDVTRGNKTRSGEDRSYDEQAIGTNFTAGGSGTVAALSADSVKTMVTSLPDRENVVYEIWHEKRQVAEISKEPGRGYDIERRIRAHGGRTLWPRPARREITPPGTDATTLDADSLLNDHGTLTNSGTCLLRSTRAIAIRLCR